MSTHTIPELDGDISLKKRKLGSKTSTDVIENNIEVQENKVTTKTHHQSPDNTIPEQTITEHDVKVVKEQVLKQLNGNFVNFSSAPTLSEKFNEIYTIFERTIRDKESHSVIVVGPRSSGKTSIVTEALSELSTKFKNEFISIHLNSSVHIDDSSALREIARQLDTKVKGFDANDDDVTTRESLEDDEDEIPVLDDEDNEEGQFASFEKKSINQTFANILSVLNAQHVGEETKMPLIFVIDEFEKFTTDTRQTLLYNLLDLSQNGDTPICVVGLTTKMTTKESLEKRVNSRFSQRVISIVHENLLDGFWNNAKLSLILNSATLASLNNASYGEEWNKNVDRLFSKDRSLLRNIVVRNFYTIKDYKEFNNNCRLPISQLSVALPYLQEQNFKVNSQGQEGIQTQIQSLSDLELLLAIAAARWLKKYEMQSINFNLAYKEYQDMVKEYNVGNSSISLENRITSNIRVNQKVWSQKVSLNSWSTLYKIGVLLDPRNDAVESKAKTYSCNINKNLIIEENQMLLLDITLDELSSFLDDKHNFKKFARL